MADAFGVADLMEAIERGVSTMNILDDIPAYKCTPITAGVQDKRAELLKHLEVLKHIVENGRRGGRLDHAALVHRRRERPEL